MEQTNDILKTKTVALIDDNGYFTGTCLVNENPKARGTWILPKNAVEELPNIQSIKVHPAVLKLKWNGNAWIEELDSSSLIKINNYVFSYLLIHEKVIFYAINANVKFLVVKDIYNNDVKLSLNELKQLLQETCKINLNILGQKYE